MPFELIKGKKAASVMGLLISTLIGVLLTVSLLPVIKNLIGDAKNLTATESAILGIFSLLIIVAVLYAIVKKSGLER